jgi:DNA-binding CsgD family transcriptional regulator
MDAPPVQYVTTSDGYDVAYAVSAEGVPLVFMPPVVSHIQLFWTTQSFIRPWVEQLAERFQLVQYDGAGQGMSSRGLTPEYSLVTLDNALEAVVNRLRLERFVLLGATAPGHAAVRYAIAHPEHVRALVLCCCSVSGRMWPVINATSLARQNWDLFPGVYMAAMRAPTPGLRQQEIENFTQSVTQQDWLTMASVWATSDISDEISSLRTPTLILHPRQYENMAQQESIRTAARIDGARIVLIDGTFEYGDAEQGVRAIEAFLASLPAESIPRASGDDPRLNGLSPREIEVLRLVATGKSNQQIANELVISLFTVNRHVSNIFTKTSAANRADATSYAHRHGIV